MAENEDAISPAKERVAQDAAGRLLALHQAARADDEPEDELAELEPAREQIRRGQTLSLADVRRELAENTER